MVSGVISALSRLVSQRRGSGQLASMIKIVALRSMAIGVNIFTGLLTAAVLGPAGRGEQAALIIGPQFLAPLATFGLHASFIYNSKASPEHEREYFGANLIMTGCTGLLVMVIGWFVAPHWLSHYSAHTIMLGRWLLCTLPFTVMTWGILGAAEARGWFGLSNGTLYIQSLCILALLATLWKFGVLTPGLAAIAYTVPTIPAFIYFAWRVCSRIKPVFTLRAPFPRRLLRYGARFYGIDLVGSLSSYLDQLIVVVVLPSSQVGIYAVALSSARMLTILQAAVSSVLFPSIAARGTRVVVETVAATVRAASLVTAVAVAGMAVVGPFLLHLAYGARFGAAVGPFRVLLVDVLVISSVRILYQAYSGSGKPEWVTVFEVIGVASSILLMTAMIPRFGLLGASLAVLASSTIRLACAIAGLRPLLKVPVPRLIVNRSDVLGWRRGPPLAGEVAP